MADNLEQLSKRQLIELVRQLIGRVDWLQARVEELERENARLKKNSSTSSKPPSSDIVKPTPKTVKGKGHKRKIGGQPGHPKHERTPFSPDQLDAVWDYTFEQCPDCGGELKRARRKPRIVQQVELIAEPIRIEEHRAHACWCPGCRKHHYAPLPDVVVKGGLAGPRLTALVAYLKGGCHASYSTIQAFLRDVLGLPMSPGQIVKLIKKTRRALDGAYDELLAKLPDQAHLNIDETGHKQCGKKLWTWCFRAKLYTLFKIDPSRGSRVLIEVLGKAFAGVIGSDFFSAYRKYMGDFNVAVQFCLAHLIRDVKYLTTLDAATKKYGHRLLDHLRKLFKVIHRRETMTTERFEESLQQTRKKLVAAAKHPPWTPEAKNMADRFRKHGDAYFRFITTPGVEPTNNLAEQAIRFVVIDRKVTQGTRGDAGQRWCERIWTVMATCTQQNQSAFDFLHQSVRAHLTGQPAPSLLFNPS
ncbi:MAG: IS66 family transposase [Planctomycetes bacterium]|nr:IS66 family transposase [Planctomycetota bacterium]